MQEDEIISKTERLLDPTPEVEDIWVLKFRWSAQKNRRTFMVTKLATSGGFDLVVTDRGSWLLRDFLTYFELRRAHD